MPALWLRRAVLGLAGSLTLLLFVTLSTGVFYIWLMTGLPPDAQIRRGGLGIVEAWLLGGLFGGLHLAGAFLLEPYGPWGIVGITSCLLTLWVVSLRRARALQRTVLRHYDRRARVP